MLSADDYPPILFVVVGIIGDVLILWPLRRLLGVDRDTFETLLAISTTVLLAGLIQFLTRLIRSWSERGDRQVFHDLFGTTSSAVGVVPDLRNKEGVDLDGWQPPGSGVARPKGVTKVVPFEDLQAAIKIAELFDRFGTPFELRPDYETPDGPPSQTFIAIGLGFNHLTRMLADRSGLFQIKYKDSYSEELKDDFLILDKPHEKPDENKDYALVARVPFRHDGRDVIGFVCAGRIAAGTAAAGLFLKK